jgi:hypothetical protein
VIAFYRARPVPRTACALCPLADGDESTKVFIGRSGLAGFIVPARPGIENEKVDQESADRTHAQQDGARDQGENESAKFVRRILGIHQSHNVADHDADQASGELQNRNHL